MNLTRFVLFIGHSFSDQISLKAELEVEDAKIESGKPAGEVAVEPAYPALTSAGSVWASGGTGR